MATAVVEKMEVDEPKPETKVKDVTAISIETIKEQVALIDKGEPHYIARVLQGLAKTRKLLNHEVLFYVLDAQYTTDPDTIQHQLKFIRYLPPDDYVPQQKLRSPRKGVIRHHSSVESDTYLLLLTTIFLLDQKQYQDAEFLAKYQIGKIDRLDKRSLDTFAAKTFYFLCVIQEKLGNLFDIQGYLNSRLRTATLRHYSESQAVLIYCLLRCYLTNRQYQSAAHLVSKVAFPENASNNDLARYMYYQGRIKALQLDYTAAAGYFLQAQRKAPQEGAIGFKQTVQKWLVVISLLQGEIPERSVFRQPIYRKCLAAYLDLTHAVRLGDIAKFNKVLEQHSKVFETDDTLTLIVRLRQNVIKTAIKQISSAYSRIYIKDIAKKLLMNNETETEYIVAKAIADGAIDAVITSETKESPRYMQSSETADIYQTSEPQAHFDSRIRYCLDLHTQAVKALRYPPKKKLAVESIEQQREREQQELEFAKELAEEDDEDF